jgi:putative RNA 2'-phosphotransferase
MAQNKSPHRLVKFLSYVLERRPDEFGLVLDHDGYVKVKELLKAVTEEDQWRFIRRSHLDEILITVANPPFEISDNRIRARNREHLPKHVFAQNPPKLLYTCVREKAYPFVVDKGIFPSGYPQVILSSKRGLAERIGRRIDHTPAVLTVQVQHSVEMGTTYYRAGQDLFLAEYIPAGCFSGPRILKEKTAPAKAARTEKPAAPKLAGSFILEINDKMHPQAAAGKTKTGQNFDRKRTKKYKRKREKPPWRH